MTAGARYVALDAWRGVAALMVALHHFPTNSSIYGLALVRNAYLFDDFFFVLSGFVIAANYQDRIARGFNIRRFMLLRIGRLYPLHFVMLLAFALTETLFALSGSVSDSGRDFFSGSTSPWALATNLLLIQSLGFNDGLTLNGVAWSISAEMWMYL